MSFSGVTDLSNYRVAWCTIELVYYVHHTFVCDWEKDLTTVAPTVADILAVVAEHEKECDH